MKPIKLCTALATALLLSAPLAAFAQEAEEEASSPFSATFAVTTDYVFRGVSQTDNGPAFQAGASYSAPFGLYAGVWGSNVDFGDGGPNFEVDYFVGWNKDLSDSWNLDLGVNRYTYEGASDGYGNIDYNEYIAKLEWSGPVTVGASWPTPTTTATRVPRKSTPACPPATTSATRASRWARPPAIPPSTRQRWTRRFLRWLDHSVQGVRSRHCDAGVLRHVRLGCSGVAPRSDIYKPGLVFTIAVEVP